MIGSTKTAVLSVVLVAVVLAVTVAAILLPDSMLENGKTGTVTPGSSHSVTVTEDDYYTSYAGFGTVKIELRGDSVSCTSRKVEINGTDIKIDGAGTYLISGTLTDGSITVDSADSSIVRLIFAGADITSSDGCALNIQQAEKTVLSLVPGTQNYLTDGESYKQSDKTSAPTAALYSRDDLTINGTGSLTVNGRYLDGIKVNDTLKIMEGTLSIKAADDGINANDCIYILNADITADTVSDSVKCENTDTSKGFVYLDGTSLDIISGGDGIYSSSAIYTNDIRASIKTGGGSETVQLSSAGFGKGRDGFGSTYAADDTPSGKALKAGTLLSLRGGTFTLDSADDAIHSDGDITIKGGEYTISTGNDAVHAEKELLMAADTFDVSKCLEGIEAGIITIDSGDIKVVSVDDGINAVGTSSEGFFGMPMMGNHTEPVDEEDIFLTINGGNIIIETGGDGVDSNGAARINGGILQVYGPENGGNASLDFQNGILIDAGTVLAAGNSGMAELPHTDSKQYSLVFYLSSKFDAGKTIEIVDSEGNTVISGNCTKSFNWVCASSPDIKEAETYTLYVDSQKADTITVTAGISSSGSKAGRRW